MKTRILVLVGLCGALSWGNVAGLAQTSVDQSILPMTFRTTWDPGIPGGIPADDDPNRPATVWLPPNNPYNGYSVDPALTGVGNAAAFSVAFQAAINAAGAAATPSSRKIVFLRSGIYYVNPQVDAGRTVGIIVKVDNVTIRGEGAERTRIVATGDIPDYGTVILFGHRRGSANAQFAVQNVTADALRGTHTIQIANASEYAVGDVITIDHVDGPAVQSGEVSINGGYLFFYDAQFFKRQPTYGWNGPATGAPAFPAVTNYATANAAATSVVPQWRSTSQQTEIVSVAGSTLTVRDPLSIDFPLSTNPQVWRTIPMDTAGIPVGNRWSGIEHVALAGGSNQIGFPGGALAFSYMAYAWAQGVEVDGERIPSDPAHPGKIGFSIGLGHSYRCVVRDSYVHHATDQNSGGKAYGIVIASGTSNSLIENNIARHHSKPIVSEASGGGNVIAYNYVDEAAVTLTPAWQQNGIDDSHEAFTHHDLIEGNWTPNLGSGSTHGNSGWHTHFRNYANGVNSSAAVTQNLRAVGMDGWTHDHAYVGNVLHGGTVYEMTPSNPATGSPVYQLGRNPASCGFTCWDNGYSAGHIYRDGNWDNVTNGVVWASGARAMPPSLYLTNKPAFFGPHAWPWVDPIAPSASERVKTLPAKARYDAGMPFGMAAVRLTANVESPQTAGTAIVLMAAGSGGTTPYAYRFWAQPWGGEWQLLRDWGPTATHVWVPTVAGGYNVWVQAHSSGASVVEVQTGINFQIGPGGGGVGGPMTGVTLTTSVASPQTAGTSITLTASGSGGAPPYEYRFWAQPWGDAWQLLRDWGASATHLWIPPTAGGYNLFVQARSSGSTGAEVQAAVNFEATTGGGGGGGPMTGVALTADLASPQGTGTTITLTATGSGGTAPYAYRFWVQPWSGSWQIVREFAPGAAFAWTPVSAGGYNLAVEAKSDGGTIAEVQRSIAFMIGATSRPTPTDGQ